MDRKKIASRKCKGKKVTFKDTRAEKILSVFWPEKFFFKTTQQLCNNRKTKNLLPVRNVIFTACCRLLSPCNGCCWSRRPVWQSDSLHPAAPSSKWFFDPLQMCNPKSDNSELKNWNTPSPKNASDPKQSMFTGCCQRRRKRLSMPDNNLQADFCAISSARFADKEAARWSALVCPLKMNSLPSIKNSKYLFLDWRNICPSVRGIVSCGDCGQKAIMKDSGTPWKNRCPSVQKDG